ncbi:MAG: tandem-95 repeat protein, partial [Nocardioidaceae bacterium]
MTDLPPGPDLNPNVFLDPSAPPPKPDILTSNAHVVQAGTANQEGAGFAIETGQEDSRVANTSVDLAVSARVGFVNAGVDKGKGWGSEYTHSLTQGVGFSAGIGNIPKAALGNETYDWRMFLCTKNLTTSDGHSYPVRVLDYTVDGYQGSGGLEPLGPITVVSPRQSAHTDLTPTLTWEQDSGTVKSYDWQVEAVGAPDARSGTVTYTDTVDSKENRPDVSSVDLTKELLPDQLYRWRVSATDFFGNPQASSWEYFVTQGAPDADFVIDPEEPDITQAVTLTDTSDDGGLPTTAHWTFPDGSVQTGSSVTRQFTSSGAYPVTLRVSNSAGHDQITKIVPVITGPRDDRYAGTEDTSLVVDVRHGVLANDEAPATLTASVDQQPASGRLTLKADGSFAYLPDANFCGTDGFSYLLHDGTGDTHSATVALDVACVNDPPVAADHQFDATEDAVQQVAAPGLLTKSVDPDTGDTLTARLVTHPDHGRVEVDADGSFAYTPQQNYCGADAFDYAVSDGHTLSNTATVTLNVVCVNDVPVATDDHYRVAPGQTLAVDAAHGVLANDTDAEDGTASTAKLDKDVAHGTLSLAPDGSFSYVADTGYTGTDSFTYFPGDGTAYAPSPATVTIVVRKGGAPSSGGGGGPGASPPSGGSTTVVPPGGTAASDPGVSEP